MRVLTCVVGVLSVGILVGAGPPTDKQLADATAKHDAAVQRASDAYRRAVVVADQALVDTLTQDTKPFDRTRDSSPALATARRHLADAKAQLAADEELLTVHKPVDSGAADLVQQAKADTVKRTSAGSYEAIVVGKTTEKDAVDLLHGANWTPVAPPVLTDVAVDGQPLHRATYLFTYGGIRMSITAENGVISAKSKQ